MTALADFPNLRLMERKGIFYSFEGAQEELRTLLAEHDATTAVVDRLMGDPIPWHPSLSHREWFRSTFVDGDVREPMREDEAAVLQAVYERRGSRIREVPGQNAKSPTEAGPNAGSLDSARPTL